MIEAQILLVEDDLTLGETLSERLVKEGYAMTWVTSVAEAATQLAQRRFDLLVFDVGLPDGNGFELVRWLRSPSSVGRANAESPLVFLTAMTSAEYRLEGYELGAEEYIPKPFHLKELLLRVRHVLENHRPTQNAKMDDIEIDFSALEIRTDNGPVQRLQPRDAQLLKLLMTSAPAVVSRDEILNKIWGEEVFPSSRTVDNAMVRIRQALGVRAQKRLRSIRGVGYQFVFGNLQENSDESTF